MRARPMPRRRRLTPARRCAVGTGTAPPSQRAAAARAEHEQAMARLKDGRIEEAAALFAAALAHDPGNAGYATDLGFALGRLGRRAEAETLLRGAIEKDPHRVYAWVNLAEIYADDPTRWERRDAIVAFLEKGLDVLKDDRERPLQPGPGPRQLRARHRANGRGARAAEAAAGDRRRPAPVAPAAQARARSAGSPRARRSRARARGLAPARRRPGGRRAGRRRPRAPSTAGTATACLPIAEGLVQRYPTWARALVLRARAFEAAGRVDEAARDLEIAVNLAPSNALAWRTLGKILAQHGGALEAERADEALRNALTLEPGWTDLRELRDKLARRRATASTPRRDRDARPCRRRSRAGSISRRRNGFDVGDPVGLGRELLDQALADSPGSSPPRSRSYALTGKLPPATLEALKDDGPALWALASGVRKLGQTGKKAATSDDVEALVRPLIDRAVALDVQEARFARAIARAATGDRAGARRRPDRLRRARAEPRAPGRGARAARRARGSREPARRCAALARAAGAHPPARGQARRGAARARWPCARERAGRSSGRAGPGQRVRRSAGGGARLLRDGRGDRRYAGRRGARARGDPRRAAARRGAAQGGSPHARRGGGRAHRRRRVGAGPARGGRGRSDRRARRAPSARWSSPSATRPTAISWVDAARAARPASRRQLARGRRRAPQPRGA